MKAFLARCFFFALSIPIPEPAPQIDAVPLDRAVLCGQCESITKLGNDHCPVCGSIALLNVGRILNRKMRPQFLQCTANVYLEPLPGTVKYGRPVAMTTSNQWKWFGRAAHFILGEKCRFHLATQVGEFIVSTVGELWNERAVREIHASIADPAWFAANRKLLGDSFDAAYMKRFGFEEIGVQRKYETIVFKAGKPCTAEGCNCGMPIPSDYTELAANGYNDAGAATRGHYEMCERFSAAGVASRN
jgi:hypothetical protein